ncbi:MAG: C25 family cysteine peptidase, partial [Anaerolineae bacterium]|nr:C25 family cysteine peptidase [Anaerolineae bacterium]
LVHVDPWIGETAADNRYVSVDGPSDYLPDMHVGRIPAQSPADVAAVVQKILAYETAAAAGDWQRRAVFVADDYANRDGNFHALSEPARLLAEANGYAAQAIYYRMDAAHDTGAEMRSAIQAAFNQGALYLQWFGHASQFRWGSVAMYDVLAPPQLQPNQRLPLTAHYGCWSGYFIGIQGSGQYGRNPQALGEVLLLTPGRGAVADLSPSGLHIGLALQALNQGVAQAIFRDRVARVGPAVDSARAHFAATAQAWPDVIDTTVLFGDPALKLRLPRQSKPLYLPLVPARR